jgi:DNA-binding protein
MIFNSATNINNRSYDRHELCISSKMDIGGYLGYARVQLIDEKKPFVVIKARGNAIENALKVAEMAKQTIAGVLSCTKICLQFTVEKVSGGGDSPVKRSREKLIEEIDMYETLKKDYRT